MSKRGNAEGSIYRRKDGRWVAAYTSKDGKRKALYGKTRQEVGRKLTLALKAREDGLPAPSDRILLGKFLDEWLKICKPTVRYSTWRRYEQLMRTHVKLILGKVPLTRLEPHHLQRLYSAKLNAGLSPSTVAHMHRVIHRAIEQAMRWGYVVRNVVSMVSPPKPSKGKMAILSVEQSKKLLDTARGTRLEALYVLALTTGMRQGEILALHWQNIDLDQGRLEIKYTLSWTPEGAVFSEPKTRGSKRRIELSQKAIESFKQHKANQAKERLKLGEAWENNNLVFPNEVGKPIHPGNLQRRSFKPLLEKADLPNIRFHDLRHTCASHLLSQNIHPKVVSELLGHSSITITLDTYSHVIPAMQKEAVKAMEGLLGS